MPVPCAEREFNYLTNRNYRIELRKLTDVNGIMRIWNQKVAQA